MKYYCHVYPDENDIPVYDILSEQEILDIYFYWWALRMYTVNRQDQISLEDCIMDFVVIHWAWELK